MCRARDIEQMGLTVSQWCKEHHRCVRLGYGEKSAFASHSLDLGHQVSFSDTKILFRSSSWTECLIRKLLEIRMQDCALNRENGLQLSSG